MLEIPFLNRFLASTYSRRLDDFVDRLHFEFTVWVLVLFSMFVGGKQHFGEPIQCMVPAHMSQSSWISYAQYYCFITNTYRLTYKQTVPDANVRSVLRNADGVNLNYYQWVPYFLVFQAFCFFLPNWLWRLLQSYGFPFFSRVLVLDMHTIVDEAVAIRNEIKMEKREERMTKLVDYISSSLCFSSGFSDKSLFNTSSHCSGYLLIVYVMSKLLTIANDFSQLYLIAYFLGINEVTWALHVSF
uniref:Innexin n=1 Tax=Syphacia muris TaxID=451379 RepID=A0A0N5AEE3_9BILA